LVKGNGAFQVCGMIKFSKFLLWLKEEGKEKKISHPDRFVDASTKINSRNKSIKEGR
jgi:hypothetical protein